MMDILKRLLPGLGLVAVLGGVTAWSWWMQPPPAPPPAQVQAAPPPVWKPDPRVHALDAIVAGLENDNAKLRVLNRDRDLRIEALTAELARAEWQLATRIAPVTRTARPKTSARKCPPLKSKE